MAETLEAPRAKHGHKGPARATRQRGKTPRVDVSSLPEEERNKPVQTTVRLLPAEYDLAHAEAERLNMSFNGFIALLIARHAATQATDAPQDQQQPTAGPLGTDGQLSGATHPQLPELREAS
ncbi:hypothetical protein GCM10010156_66620 [Planobispora rosea]|uniref:Uncharacterized protein n=1 Tax=Planobispora rosea TaxID=35762 RepID=A0A8J3WG07_PLARO|nr:hypothetical protein [Planobispora rosea]GGS99141.1 hypothetical protein GCM10010156_66620 [Planobispora rosea]GIH88025.1 hypothetical protein Pro02_64330 [Planobispora rosea]